jgi:hypothetical protein
MFSEPGTRRHVTSIRRRIRRGFRPADRSWTLLIEVFGDTLVQCAAQKCIGRVEIVIAAVSACARRTFLASHAEVWEWAVNRVVTEEITRRAHAIPHVGIAAGHFCPAKAEDLHSRVSRAIPAKPGRASRMKLVAVSVSPCRLASCDSASGLLDSYFCPARGIERRTGRSAVR